MTDFTQSISSDLDPTPRPAGAVGRAGPFRYDGFEPEPVVLPASGPDAFWIASEPAAANPATDV